MLYIGVVCLAPCTVAHFAQPSNTILSGMSVWLRVVVLSWSGCSVYSFVLQILWCVFLCLAAFCMFVMSEVTWCLAGGGGVCVYGRNL